MNKYGKIWGHTSEIFISDNVSIHRAEILKGRYCSKHYHQHKYNKFFIESGNIIVYRWENDHKIQTVLMAGDSIDIEPNIYHQFEAIEDSIVYEIYYIILNSNDIVRE